MLDRQDGGGRTKWLNFQAPRADILIGLMFKTVVVTEDAPLARAIEDLAQEPGLIRILKTIDRFPSSEYEVARLVTQNDPELVLLHANSPELPLEIGLAIRARFP